MAVTQNLYTGNGSTVLYSFTFPYLETTDIKVSVNGTNTTAYTLANATTIQFNTAPVNGAAIRIYRQTDDTALPATFYSGSAIRANDLNENFTQNLYVTQESTNNAASATSTANTALTNSNTAISTANTALSQSTTALSNSSTALSQSNTAISNSATALSQSNTAISDSASAVSTAATASSNASTALSQSNTALSNSSTALSQSTTALSNSTTAVSTASSAVSTANTALSTANAAQSTANTADANANAALNAIAGTVQYVLVANVAAIPGSPANGDAIEIADSTGIESFSPLTNRPAGFVGDSGLSVRLQYLSAGSSWNWLNYFPNNAETRYLKLAGGTLTGQLRADDSTSVASPVIAFDGDTNTGVAHTGADELALVTGGSARLTIDGSGNVAVPGTLGVTGAITGSSTVTGTALIPTSSTVPTNGVYLPAANSVAISTGGSGRLFVDASGRLLVNNSSAVGSATGVQGALQAQGVDGLANANFGRWSDDTAGYAVYFGKSRGTSIGSQAAVSSGDFLGALFFEGSDGTQLRRGAAITANVDGAVASNNVPGSLVFQTASGGTISERLRITSAGLVGVGTSSPVNTLDVNGGVGVAYATGLRGYRDQYTVNNIILRHQYVGSDDQLQLAPIGDSPTSAIALRTASGSTLSTRVLIDSSGRVGIGTSSPAGQLDVSDGTIANTQSPKVYLCSENGADRVACEIRQGRYNKDVLVVSSNQSLSANLFNAIENGTSRFVITGAGSVGIGNTAPGNQNAAASQLVVGNTSQNNGITILTGTTNDGVLNFNDGDNNSVRGYVIYEHSTDSLRFASNGSERFRCDSSGRLLVGTSTSTNNIRLSQKLSIVNANADYGGASFTSYSGASNGDLSPILDFQRSRGTTDGSMTVVASGDALGFIVFRGADGTNFVNSASIAAHVDGTPGANDMPGRLVFSVTRDGSASPTSAMRITNSGRTVVLGNTNAFDAYSEQGAGTSYELFIGGHSATTTAPGSGTNSFRVFTNGNVQNTNNSYGSISDAKLKENIVDAGSQWNDLKSLQVRKYNFKEETGQQTHTQIGLVAQEVELVSPGLVTESPDRDAEGNDLGTVTKSVNYSVLYMKAVKALQEAMERIETLEAKVAALEAA